jgi:hypothetical protein
MKLRQRNTGARELGAKIQQQIMAENARLCKGGLRGYLHEATGLVSRDVSPALVAILHICEMAVAL